MKDIVIFEDGKVFRGQRAKLIKRDHKRVLIQFIKYDSKEDKDILTTEWFNLFIPSYALNKKDYKHNNKRKSALYYHAETNEFYSDEDQTEEYKAIFKESYTKDYYEELYGDK